MKTQFVKHPCRHVVDFRNVAPDCMGAPKDESEQAINRWLRTRTNRPNIVTHAFCRGGPLQGQTIVMSLYDDHRTMTFKLHGRTGYYEAKSENVHMNIYTLDEKLWVEWFEVDCDEEPEL